MESMEIMLRCELADRPGSLAALAGAISEAGGDIQAVNIVEAASKGHVLDDLMVVVDQPQIGELLDRVRGLASVDLIHAGPSRGHPGDAVTRLAVGLEALLLGTMERARAVSTLVGGLLRADAAELVAHGDAPPPDGRTLVLPFDELQLVLKRAYRFTEAERERADALLRLCQLSVSALSTP